MQGIFWDCSSSKKVCQLNSKQRHQAFRADRFRFFDLLLRWSPGCTNTEPLCSRPIYEDHYLILLWVFPEMKVFDLDNIEITNGQISTSNRFIESQYLAATRYDTSIELSNFIPFSVVVHCKFDFCHIFLQLNLCFIL